MHKTTKTIKTIGCILTAVLIAASIVYYKVADGISNSAAASAQAVQTVKIAYLPITHALPVFEVKEELEAENSDLRVELVKFSAWSELLDALNTGQVDGASVLVELAMKAKSEGVDLKLAALGHRDGNVIVANDKVQSAKDLRGKTVAIPHRQSSHNILVNLELATAGLTIDDIQVTEMAPTEMPSALATGQIDAYCVAEPFGAKGVSLGGHVLDTSENLWQDSICCGLVLNGAFVSNHGETAARFVSAYTAAGDHLTAEKALAVAKANLGQEEDILKTSLQWISYDHLEVTEETYDALNQYVKRFGLNENPPSYTDFVYQPGEEASVK